MPFLSRRAFAQRVALAAAALPMAMETTLAAPANADAAGVDVHWLEGAVPTIRPGVTWGVPWPRGTFRSGQEFALRAPDGETPVQTWPLAYWPDGSLKWTGHATGKGAAGAETVRLVPVAKGNAPAPAITVQETGDALTVDTGAVRCHIPKRGTTLVASLEIGGKSVAVGGQLVCLRRDAPEPEADGVSHQETFTGNVEKATVEQNGPIRAVVRLEGWHVNAHGRSWLPFIIRLYFYANSEAVRLVHTFVFNGDESKDFISGLGVRFTVPFSDPLHDRHVRFAGENDGLWAEAVRTLTGLRRDPGQDARQAQVAGRPAPPVESLPDAVDNRLHLIPAWGDFTLSQPTADGFEIRKRTKPGHAWVKAGAGKRAAGLVSLTGATGGGIALGLRHFWERYPSRLDIRDAHTENATVTAWLWSPDAPPMDLRFYHDGLGMNTHADELEGLEITYEDYEKGWGTPHGIARTNELMLWALPATPPRPQSVALSHAVRTPPLLVCRPEHLLKAGVFPGWNLVNRSTLARKRIEDQNDYLLALFQGQVEQRGWYGFWDHGDVMHSYDGDRHEWKYDVGGFAWANAELSPELWLWYSYLRSGRADVFRFAEAMTRHTSEVDVYHLGRFAGLGTRHNVQHWGDSSKQVRVSTAAYRRMFYYLTADERTGDLLRSVLDADQRLMEIDITRKVRKPGQTRAGVTMYAGFGTDWCSFAAAWLTEWERTGDTRWRDKIVSGLKAIGAMPHGWFTGSAGYDPAKDGFIESPNQISVSHLSAVFGAVEINAELLTLLDVPAYEKTWLDYCELYNAPADEQEKRLGQALGKLNLGESHSRLTAYAAHRRRDPVLAARAWREFFAGRAGLGVHDDLTLQHLTGPVVLNPVDEGFGLSCNAASQWGLAALQNLALIGEWLKED